MININRPQLVIIAGPNGAGKSTVVEFLYLNRSIADCVNADVIAKGMAANGEGSSDILAGRILLQVVHDALARRVSVAFESTMSGISWRKLIKDSQSMGYDVTICFVAVESEQISIARVAKRVLEGGHDIPEETIKRRYKKSMSLGLGEYRALADFWYFFDNSNSSAKLVAAREKGCSEVIVDHVLWSRYEAWNP